MNRATAKRTLFEDRDDFRFFQSHLARQVRRELIEVHAFSLMPTHFHLLARSPLGELDRAMANIQREYARGFNRRRRRDGPLFRNRFRSKPVGSLAYRSILVRYLDDNPVAAGLVDSAVEYPYGSARHYQRIERPPWLQRKWIEEEVRSAAGCPSYRPRDYPVRFPSRLSPALREWLDMRVVRSAAQEDEFEKMMRRPAGQALRRMIHRARLADGTDPWGLPLPVGIVISEIDRLEDDLAGAGAEEPTSMWLRAGLLRRACGLTLREVRARTAMSHTVIHKAALLHDEMLQSDSLYAGSVQRVLDGVQATIAHAANPPPFPAAFIA